MPAELLEFLLPAHQPVSAAERDLGRRPLAAGGLEPGHAAIAVPGRLRQPEPPLELLSTRLAVGGQELQRPSHGSVDVVRYIGAYRLQRGRCLRELLRENHLDGRTRVRWLSREKCVEHTRERVDITPGVHLVVSRGLFRTHVTRSSERDTSSRQSLFFPGIQRERDPEVGDERTTPTQEDIARLDVPVHDALSVRDVECFGYVGSNCDGLIDGKLLLPLQPIPERFALDVRHNVVGEAVRLSRIVERDDV